MKKILITGTAGFIGFHLVERLIKEGDWDIIGLDNINDYYDINLKYARLKESGIDRERIEYNRLIDSTKSSNYHFIKLDLIEKENILNLFKLEKFDYIVNLAAQAGVRYSLENPNAYIDCNIYGFFNILECCRHFPVRHLIYASSSSVYGDNKKIPFSEDDKTDTPISLYAATKKSNELLAYTYSYLFNIPTTGLRLFTVYGPWGRPDMAYFKFAKTITENKSIEVYNHGNMKRDFTYIDDIIDRTTKLIFVTPPKMDNSKAQFNIVNLGNSSPVDLLDFIKILSRLLKRDVSMKMMPLQDGDVEITYADNSNLNKLINYKPITNIEIGLKKFVEWFKTYYDII